MVCALSPVPVLGQTDRAINLAAADPSFTTRPAKTHSLPRHNLKTNPTHPFYKQTLTSDSICRTRSDTAPLRLSCTTTTHHPRRALLCLTIGNLELSTGEPDNAALSPSTQFGCPSNATYTLPTTRFRIGPHGVRPRICSDDSPDRAHEEYQHARLGAAAAARS